MSRLPDFPEVSMELSILILPAVLFLAFANGTNDNFKGVATLYGSRTLSRRTALIWGTITTLAGSITAAWLATELMALFSGKGLVPNALVSNPSFTLSVVLAAASTVWLAARRGLPISTTHALVGALTGAGIAATAGHIHWQGLISGFLWPLLASPFIALTLAAMLYRFVSHARKHCGISREQCICLANGRIVPTGTNIAQLQAAMPELVIDDIEHCRRIERYQGMILGLPLQTLVEALHIFSSGAVSFARGLNDTPKIVGVALLASSVDAQWLTFAAAGTMAIGGMIGSARIADTMGDRITEIEHGKGLVANLVTSFLVIIASKWGVPVSTTHVSTGAIFGIGSDTATTNWRLVRTIILAWFATLPVAALIAALIFILAN